MKNAAMISTRVSVGPVSVFVIAGVIGATFSGTTGATVAAAERV